MSSASPCHIYSLLSPPESANLRGVGLLRPRVVEGPATWLRASAPGPHDPVFHIVLVYQERRGSTDSPTLLAVHDCLFATAAYFAANLSYISRPFPYPQPRDKPDGMSKTVELVIRTYAY